MLDAAITVLGERAIHGLAHRGPSTTAPTGSTANLFSTRDALLDAVVERFSARERGPHRTLTLARYAILVEAGIQPALRAQLLHQLAVPDPTFDP